MITDNLISAYNFDQLSNNAIDLQNNHTALNSNVTYVTGKIGNGALYNSASSLFMTGPIIPTSSDYTISMWIYRNDNDNYSWLYDQRSGDNGFSMIVASINNANELQLQLRNYDLSEYVLFSSTGTLAKDNWYHLVITKASTTVTLYINNVADGGGTSAAINDFETVTYFGQSYQGSDNSDCIQDMLYIWSRALSTAEISTLYNGGAGYRISKPIGPFPVFLQDQN